MVTTVAVCVNRFAHEIAPTLGKAVSMGVRCLLTSLRSRSIAVIAAGRAITVMKTKRGNSCDCVSEGISDGLVERGGALDKRIAGGGYC